MAASPCPCGNGAYADCCEPLHDGIRAARTAEELMRSRYSAFAIGLSDYVFRTWHPRTRPQDVSIDGLTWSDLRILSTVEGGEDDDEGVVEFSATYAIGPLKGEVHEHSGFLRHAGRWHYVAPVSES